MKKLFQRQQQPKVTDITLKLFENYFLKSLKLKRYLVFLFIFLLTYFLFFFCCF